MFSRCSNLVVWKCFVSKGYICERVHVHVVESRRKTSFQRVHNTSLLLARCQPIKITDSSTTSARPPCPLVDRSVTLLTRFWNSVNKISRESENCLTNIYMRRIRMNELLCTARQEWLRKCFCMSRHSIINTSLKWRLEDFWQKVYLKRSNCWIVNINIDFK